MAEKDPVLAEVTDHLMSQRTLLLGEVTTATVDEIIRRLLVLQARSSAQATLLIDSEGGNMHAAFTLCDVLEHVLTIPVRGVVVGTCESAATFIFLCCSERIATPHASFCIHSTGVRRISLTADEHLKYNVARLMEEMEVVEDQATHLYIRKLQKSKEEIQQLRARGNEDFNERMTATEAKEVGIVDEVIESKLDIFPPAE